MESQIPRRPRMGGVKGKYGCPWESGVDTKRKIYKLKRRNVYVCMCERGREAISMLVIDF